MQAASALATLGGRGMPACSGDLSAMADEGVLLPSAGGCRAKIALGAARRIGISS